MRGEESQTIYDAYELVLSEVEGFYDAFRLKINRRGSQPQNSATLRHIQETQCKQAQGKLEITKEYKNLAN